MQALLLITLALGLANAQKCCFVRKWTGQCTAHPITWYQSCPRGWTIDHNNWKQCGTLGIGGEMACTHNCGERDYGCGCGKKCGRNSPASSTVGSPFDSPVTDGPPANQPPAKGPTSQMCSILNKKYQCRMFGCIWTPGSRTCTAPVTPSPVPQGPGTGLSCGNAVRKHTCKQLPGCEWISGSRVCVDGQGGGAGPNPSTGGRLPGGMTGMTGPPAGWMRGTPSPQVAAVVECWMINKDFADLAQRKVACDMIAANSGCNWNVKQQKCLGGAKASMGQGGMAGGTTGGMTGMTGPPAGWMKGTPSPQVAAIVECWMINKDFADPAQRKVACDMNAANSGCNWNAKQQKCTGNKANQGR